MGHPSEATPTDDSTRHALPPQGLAGPGRDVVAIAAALGLRGLRYRSFGQGLHLAVRAAHEGEAASPEPDQTPPPSSTAARALGRPRAPEPSSRADEADPERPPSSPLTDQRARFRLLTSIAADPAAAPPPNEPASAKTTFALLDAIRRERPTLAG